MTSLRAVLDSGCMTMTVLGLVWATVSVRACGTPPQVRFDEKPQQRHHHSGSAWTVKPFA